MITKIILKLLKTIIIITGVYFILSYLFVISQRIVYPFHLELCEGLMMDHCVRILNHKAIYLEPNAEFISSMYPPFYFWVSALFMKIFGVNFWTPRVISILSSFVVGFFIFKIVKKETHSNFLGFVCLSMFFASYRFVGFWFDIVRVDAFFIALIMLSIYILTCFNKNSAIFLSAIVLSLSFFTKQTAIFFILACGAYVYFFDKKKFVLFSLMTSLFCLVGILLLNYKTQGCFWHYVFFIPSKHTIIKSNIIIFFKNDLFDGLFFMIFPILIYYLWKIKKSNFSKSSLLLVFCLLSSLIAAFSVRILIGAERNSLIPFIVFLIISFGIALKKIEHIFYYKNKFQELLLKTTVYILILLQFSIFSYNPKFCTTITQNHIAGNKFINAVENINGDVFIPEYGFYSTMATKKMHMNYDALLNAIYWFKPNLFNKRELPQDLVSKIKNKKYAAIILESPNYTNPLMNLIKKYYFSNETISSKEEKPFPFPNYIYRPIK